MTTFLVTGIAGSIAQLTAHRLRDQGHKVVGVDYRRRPAGLPDDLPTFQANYNKTMIEDVFRHHRPDVVLHLGRVGNLKVEMNKRFDLNVLGSAKMQELSVKYSVKRLVVLSTFHIYGAHPHNHIPIFEDEPLRAAQTFPELADAVQLDNQAVTWVYRHPECQTVVLRPCNVIGPHTQNAISRYLRQRRIAYIAGFSPMWQFLHEDDLVEAIVRVAHHDATGVYNVAGAGPVPLVCALRQTGASLVPVPSPLGTLLLKLQGRFAPAFPPYLLDFFRYPCIISDDRLRETFGYAPRYGIVETIRACTEQARLASAPI